MMTATKPRFTPSLFPATGRLYLRDDEFCTYTGAYHLNAAQVVEVQAILNAPDALPNSLRGWLDNYVNEIGRRAGIQV